MSAKNPSAKNRSAKQSSGRQGSAKNRSTGHPSARNLRSSTHNSVAARKSLPASRNAVPELQRQLLVAGIKQPNGRLRFARRSAETLATTYAALLSLQHEKLIAPEKEADPQMMSWKVTRAGKAVVAEKAKPWSS
jgi:hypothetical protein